MNDPKPHVLMLGASSTPVCGVRDYAGVQQQALRSLGAAVTSLWWERDLGWSVLRTAREAATWASEARAAARWMAPDCVLWHYSVFTYGHRGIPHLAPVIARGLAGIRVPVVAVLHELAYSFGRGGWRGWVWALTQRAGLWPVVRTSDGVIVTTEGRARWLLTRRWLPRRPVAFVPICSNLPLVARPPDGRHGADPSVGVFGFGADGFAAEPVVSAVAHLRRRGLNARLVLVGAPGAGSPPGRAWESAAAGAGCADALVFTGLLDPPTLAGALSELDVVILPDEGGPSSRKTTLAAALAQGKPVVALDGPHRWEPLVREEAVVLASRANDGVAREIEALLRDPDLRARQGERAAAFYRQRMAPEVVAGEILALLQSIGTGEQVGW